MRVFSLLVTRFASLFIISITNMVLANNLSLSQYGIYKTIVSFLTMISFISLPGINESLTFILSNSKKGGINLVKKRTYNIYLITFILVIIFFLFYFGLINVNFEINIYWLIGLLLIPNYLIIEVITSGYIALKNYKLFNYFQLTQYGLTLLAIIVAINLGIRDGPNIILITMIICAIPFHFFNKNLNLSKGKMDEETKKLFRKLNLSKAPQILLNTDILIFLIGSGAVASGEIGAFSVVIVGLKTIYGVAQNRLTNFLYKTNLWEIGGIIKSKKLFIYYIYFIFVSIITSIFIIPYFFKIIFNESFHHIIPIVKTYSSIYLITCPISLLNIPVKVKLGLKGNLFINTIHPIISFLFTVYLSKYGVEGYLITRIIMIFTINLYYIISFYMLFKRYDQKSF